MWRRNSTSGSKTTLMLARQVGGGGGPVKGALKYEAHPQPSSQRDSKLQNKEEEKKS